jgi:two-component system sensor histidine kinase/response regulator
MNAHLAKPIDPDELFKTLLRWIPPRAKSAAMASAASSGSAANVVSPAASGDLVIAGIDTVTALKRTGGNRTRYEALLQRFADSQAHAVDDIRAALAASDAPTAQRIAHSLKGASANLGADALAEVAAAAEAAIESNQAIASNLESLARSLDTTIAAVRVSLPHNSPAAITRSAHADASAVVPVLTRLKKLLETDDGDASDFLLEARPQLAQVLLPTEVDALLAHVGNFAYSDALHSLAGIAARLSLSLE